MSFSMEDVLEILKIAKNCDDSALRIEMGDMKLSLVKGDVADSAVLSIGCSSDNASQKSAPAQECVQAAPTAKAPQAAPAQKEAAPAAKVEPKVAAKEENNDAELVAIRSSVTSVFYRRPNPDEPPFVEEGSVVKADTIVCLLEVMKCFQSVTAGVNGVIEKICVENADLVETGTILYLVRPV